MSKISLKVINEQVNSMNVDEALHYLSTLKNNSNLNIDKIIDKFTKRKEKENNELIRLANMSLYEDTAYAEGYSFIAGVDEAGRGPLAGPVVAAAVILPPDYKFIGINDSKKLSAKQRDSLFDEINEHAIAYSVGIVNEKVIDEINILRATKKAMKIAVDGLTQSPDVVLVDAERIDNIPQKQLPIIKGDSLSVSIAAASIIAKVTRDRIIDELSNHYPQYNFSKHKGYGTKEHIDAIKKFGICPIHRISFTKNFVS